MHNDFLSIISWFYIANDKTSFLSSSTSTFIFPLLTLFRFGNSFSSEPETDAEIRFERDGGALHRRTQIIHQSFDGQFRIVASQQRFGRLALRSATLQTLQRQRVRIGVHVETHQHIH